LIGALVEKEVAGRPTSFYRLALLDNSGDAVFVPVDKLSTLRIRQLMGKSEIPKLLGHLAKSVAVSKNWKQRDIDNAKLLSTGSAFDLAEIIESLTELNERRILSPRDRQKLDKARKFLICEISEVRACSPTTKGGNQAASRKNAVSRRAKDRGRSLPMGDEFCNGGVFHTRKQIGDDGYRPHVIHSQVPVRIVIRWNRPRLLSIPQQKWLGGQINLSRSSNTRQKPPSSERIMKPV
jgi:RNA polymerase-interacting CarD/CdnL/TRCF family regulator